MGAHVDPRELVLRTLEILQLHAPCATQEAKETKHEAPSVFRKHSTWKPGAPWPSKTGMLCWHCCHAIPEQPIPMPVKYDSARNVFTVTGAFCGFPCIKTFNSERNSYLRATNANTITLFHKRWTGVLTHIKGAPPRMALQAFGGWLSIEEFRNSEKVSTSLLPPKMLPLEYIFEQQAAQASGRIAPVQNLSTTVDFKDVTTKNENLKLKRSKPLQVNRNTLERTMGINMMMQLVS